MQGIVGNLKVNMYLHTHTAKFLPSILNFTLEELYARTRRIIWRINILATMLVPRKEKDFPASFIFEVWPFKAHLDKEEQEREKEKEKGEWDSRMPQYTKRI